MPPVDEELHLFCRSAGLLRSYSCTLLIPDTYIKRPATDWSPSWILIFPSLGGHWDGIQSRVLGWRQVMVLRFNLTTFCMSTEPLHADPYPSHLPSQCIEFGTQITRTGIYLLEFYKYLGKRLRWKDVFVIKWRQCSNNKADIINRFSSSLHMEFFLHT